MKRIKVPVSIVVVALFGLALAGCSTGSPVTTEGSTAADPSRPLDLTGEWKQSNSGSTDSWQAGTISAESMEINWISDGGDTKSLYWAGTYVAPTSPADTYSWESANDTEKTAGALLASTAATKTFEYEDGVISYEVSLMGTTTIVRLEREAQTPGGTESTSTSSTTSVKPDAEIAEYGFGQARGYVWVTALVHNVGRVGDFATVHFNLLDEAGNLLASGDQVESFVSQEGVTAIGTQVAVPEGAEVATIEPTLSVSDYGDSADPKPTIAPVPLTLTEQDASFILTNDSIENWENVRVGIVCREASGAITGGGSAYPNLVPAQSQSIEEVLGVIKSDGTTECTAYPSLSGF